MTAQPPLPLIPAGAVEIGAAAAMIEDDDGGRIFLHGTLAFAWDAGDTAARRFAAVSLMRIKAGTQVQIAAAFGTSPLTVWRWERTLTEAGVTGLAPQRKGPRRASKLTPEMIATIGELRGRGGSLRAIGDRVGVSEATVRRALADTDTDTEEGGITTVPAASPEPEPVAEPVAETEPGSGTGDRQAPVLAEPVDRSDERVAAAFGLISSAPPVFTGCARAPLAGLVLALPGLAATGLLETAHVTYGATFPNGFYSLDTMLCESVFRALLGEARAEGAARIDPVALGRILGLDRAPEVKTIRRKIGYLTEAGRAGQWIAAMAHRHARARPEQSAVLYVDGHVRAYQGTRKIAKTHVPRLKFPAPATVETWVSDAAGDPLLVVLADPAASLAAELRRLIPDLRAMVGDDRRVLVGFDRGGWSPALFADLDAAGFDTLTWRKGPTADVAEDLFAEHTHTDEAGRTHPVTLADTDVELEIADGPRAGQVFAMRQISLRDPARSRQLHILTTRRDLSAAQIRWRMGSRWRQENYFRYARMHFDLDSHDCYRVGDDDGDRMVPNPAKKPAYQAVEKARRELRRAEIDRDTALLAASSPAPGSSILLTNETLAEISSGVDTAQAVVDAALATHKAIPARLPLAQVNPDQQVLETETKLIHHAIRIAAFNTAQSLARAVRVGTGYARAADEAHTLIRTALAGSGDIVPDPATGTLHIRLDPLPTPRQTDAIAELCALLNDTGTVYPGTDLTLRYSIKPHH
ncbi:helix-turn-helix domain-containing protein [Rhodococcus sp. WS4]|nr:helix-turn-helix domain-containing protein [Rhodococcus sp. WS4]